MSGSPEFVRLMAQMNKTISGLKELRNKLIPPRERHSYYWYNHHTYSKTMTDCKFLDAVGAACDQKLKEKGNFVYYNRSRFDPRIKAIRKRFSKLRKIIKLEHELCGEEDW